MNLQKSISLFKEKLLRDIQKVNFNVLKENWNKIFEREKHTRMIFDEDEVVPILESEWYGDDVFLKNELEKDINYMCNRFNNDKKNSDDRNFSLLIDYYYWLLEALATTLNISFKSYLNLFKNMNQ
ncbi:MG296/MPN423 family protein [Mycoplasmoides pirum]|uniref:MG296/MPN423 family protein n=1 Tax=Mycoplasmoides pirum TaxID=2122 RepID=UPI0004899152|nr:MG296/MPN423 family protein [Mycoplasmoides pirum]